MPKLRHLRYNDEEKNLKKHIFKIQYNVLGITATAKRFHKYSNSARIVALHSRSGATKYMSSSRPCHRRVKKKLNHVYVCERMHLFSVLRNFDISFNIQFVSERIIVEPLGKNNNNNNKINKRLNKSFLGGAQFKWRSCVQAPDQH